MATMYVFNIPNNETVNLRKTASSSGAVLVRVPYGKAVQANYHNSTWHSATYNGYSGYIMSKFLTATDPNGGSSGGGGSYIGQGTVIGGRLYCRKQPQAGYAYWGQFNTGDTIPIYSCSTSGWYETRWPANGSNIGFVMTQFIQMGGGGGSATYAFDASKTVNYALNHSDNFTGGACLKRNTAFPSIDGTDDCADFAHQCICCGGVPMFDGWFYRLAGIPSNWTNSKWGVTGSGLARLKAKGWVTQVAYNQVQPGDLVYSYDPKASPTPYPHVTIAVSANVNDNGRFGCMVCGNTQNQHNKFKLLTSANCEIYRVNASLSGNGTEKAVNLPISGNGATVL